jgi:4-carboxymuconolactone decarboxylase
MRRIPEISLDDLTAEQREIYHEAESGRRGHLPAPLTAWIRSPELGRHAHRLGEFVRFDTTLPKRLSELAVSLTTHIWKAPYEWQIHSRGAIDAGIPAAAIEAIAAGRVPELAHDDERAIYAFTAMLHEQHEVSDDVLAEVVRHVGEQGAVELVGVLGYYTFVAMTLGVAGIGP